MFCPYTDPQMVSKGQAFFSEDSHVAYQIKGKYL